jgi:hypothetical protein
MVGYSAKGNWAKLSIGSATATVEKDSDGDTVTLTAEPIHKKATWTVTGSAVASEEVGRCC